MTEEEIKTEKAYEKTEDKINGKINEKTGEKTGANTNDKANEKTADSMFKDFKEVSVTEFFRKNKSQLGYSGKMRSLTTIVHELLTNSIDACEEAGILPSIEVGIQNLGEEHYSIYSKDNGPGIPREYISGVFGKMLAGTKFHRNMQLRGQQGIGVSGVTMFCQMTTGKPIHVKTCLGGENTENECYDIKLMVDITKNNAEILEERKYFEKFRGTIVECEVKEVLYSNGDQGPFEYLRRTAISNPHCEIVFLDPEGRKTVFERSSDKPPPVVKEVKPHPSGVTVDDIISMSKNTEEKRVSSFLMKTLSRISQDKINELRTKLSSGEILNKKPSQLTWKECEEIIAAFKTMKFLAPSIEGLRPIGENHITNALKNIMASKFIAAVTRPPKIHSGGIPFQVEVAISYGGCSGRKVNEGVRSELMRFSNCTPLLFDAGGCAITKAIKEVDWKRYEIKDLENYPVAIFVNLVSTYIPYTSAGKQSISDEEEIVKEIKFALMEVGRKFQVYMSGIQKDALIESRKKVLETYVNPASEAIGVLTGKDSSLIADKFKKIVRLKYAEEEKYAEEQNNVVEEVKEV